MAKFLLITGFFEFKMFKNVFVENSIRISVWPKNSCGFLIGNKIDDVYNVFFFVQYAGEINVENIPNLKKRTDELFRILPGSISVLGLYYVAEHSGLNYDSDKILKDYSMITNDYTKIFILVNANNYKFCARRIDLSEDKCKFEDIDIEYEDILSGYQSFQSDIIIKLDIYIHSEYDINLILKEFKDLVNPFITDYLSKSIMNVNGEELNPGAQFGEQLKSQLELTFHDEDGEELHPGAQFGEQLELQSSSIEGINLGGLMLEESSFENNNSRLELAFHDVDGEELHPGAQFGAQLKSQSELTFHDVNMDIFFNKLLKSESEKDFELVNRVQIQGRISVVAFLPTLATMQEVSNALKQDFTRSLFARLELLTEKEGEIKVSQMLLPRRVKVMLPWCPTLPLSEYKFSSETELDVISRIKDFCRPPGMSDEQLDSKCVNMGIEQLEQESDDALHIITIPNIDKNIQEIRHFEKKSTIAEEFILNKTSINECQLIPKWNDNINITGDIGKYHEYFDITIDLEVDGNMEPYGPTSRPLRNLDYRSPKHISFSVFLPREKFMITGNYVGVLSDLLVDGEKNDSVVKRIYFDQFHIKGGQILPDGDRIVFITDKNSIGIWNHNKGELQHVSYWDYKNFKGIEVSPKGDYMLLTTIYATILVVETTDFNIVSKYSFENMIRSIAFSHEGKYLHVLNVGGQISIIEGYKSSNFDLVHTWNDRGGDDVANFARKIAFSPNNEFAACGSLGFCHIYKLEDCFNIENPIHIKRIYYLDGLVDNLSFNNCSEILAIGYHFINDLANGGIQLVDMKTLTMFRDFPSGAGTSCPTSLAFSPNSKYLAVGRFDGRITTFNLKFYKDY